MGTHLSLNRTYLAAACVALGLFGGGCAVGADEDETSSEAVQAETATATSETDPATTEEAPAAIAAAPDEAALVRDVELSRTDEASDLLKKDEPGATANVFLGWGAPVGLGWGGLGWGGLGWGGLGWGGVGFGRVGWGGVGFGRVGWGGVGWGGLGCAGFCGW